MPVCAASPSQSKHCNKRGCAKARVASAFAISVGQHQNIVSAAARQITWVDACGLRWVLTHLASGRVFSRLNLSKGILLLALHDRILCDYRMIMSGAKRNL